MGGDRRIFTSTGSRRAAEEAVLALSGHQRVQAETAQAALPTAIFYCAFLIPYSRCLSKKFSTPRAAPRQIGRAMGLVGSGRTFSLLADSLGRKIESPCQMSPGHDRRIQRD
jgi:hypothetical protein